MDLTIKLDFENIKIYTDALKCGNCGGKLLFIKTKSQKIVLCEKCKYNKFEVTKNE